jgi:hypothetical protein
MCTRMPSLLMRLISSPLAPWIVIVALIVVETLVVYPLRRSGPEISLEVVYLVGVLVVWSVWAGAELVTAVLSAARDRQGMGSAVER